MKREALLGAIAVSLISGCAPNTDTIQSEYVSPETYANYDCQQIGAEFGRLSRRAEELGAVVDKQAQDDQAQAFVGLVLFWPALFFLEGSETQQTMEYSRLKGEMEALEKVSVEKGCGVDIQHLAESASTGAVVATNPQKLEALKVLYRDGAITEEEYLKRRKEITEAQAKQELAALEREKIAAATAATPQQAVLKVAIFYTLGDTGRQAEHMLIDFAEGHIKRHNRLELKYSYYSDNFDVVEPGMKLWVGRAERQPLKENVYRAGAQIGADVVLMYYLFTSSSYGADIASNSSIKIFVFDMKNRREYHSESNEKTYKQETERLFEELIAS